MREKLLLDVPHRQVVFTIPKMLRVFFKYNRSLLSGLCLCGKEALLKYFKAVAGRELTPGIIDHLKLTFMAERPPPPQIVQQELLMAAEERGDFF